MADPKAFLWVDLETTGVDETRDEVLEVACILTNLELEQLGSFHTLVQLTNNGHARLNGNDFVHNMHTENGLLQELTKHNHETPNINEADAAICRWLEQGHGFTSSEKTLMLAGSGVSHFDRRFIKKWLPGLETKLQYPNLDVGVVRRFGTLTVGLDVPNFNDGKTHRGMDDIKCHLQEAAWFVKTLQGE